MLKTEYIRDSKNQLIGTKTTGYASGDTIARDPSGKLLGRANTTFRNTRDANGGIVSRNQADAGLLFRR
jgi:hypothetical protein